MIDQFRKRLNLILSEDRLSVYANPTEDDISTIVNYFWNISICQSLYPGLGLLEVSVRNQLHRVLSTHFCRDDWYDSQNVLQKRELSLIATAKASIQRSGKPVTSGRIVAALTFGFWTSLLSTIYGNSPKGPRLWRSPQSLLLEEAFPYAPSHARGVRGPIYNQLDDIRRLRNRVFHFERILHGIELPSRKSGYPPRNVSIDQMYSIIMDTIGWIDPDVKSLASTIDGFTQVHQFGHETIKREIQFHLTNH